MILSLEKNNQRYQTLISCIKNNLPTTYASQQTSKRFKIACAKHTTLQPYTETVLKTKIFNEEKKAIPHYSILITGKSLNVEYNIAPGILYHTDDYNLILFSNNINKELHLPANMIICTAETLQNAQTTNLTHIPVNIDAIMQNYKGPKEKRNDFSNVLTKITLLKQYQKELKYEHRILFKTDTPHFNIKPY